jgi:hypothetical protein
LIDAAKDLSSSTEVMTGSGNADNAKTGAVMALQQQGLKIFTSIQRRIYRSLANELQKLFKLNSIYLSPEQYYNLLDDTKAVKQDDFEIGSIDVIPVADPNLSSDLQRSARAQLLLAVQGLPGIDPLKVTKLLLQNANLGVTPEEIMLSPEAMDKPNPEAIKIQADIENMSQEKQLKAKELEIKEKEVMAKLYEIQCKCLELKSSAILNLAKAESESANVSLSQYQMQLDILNKQMEAITGMAEFGRDNQIHRDEMDAWHKEMDIKDRQAQQQVSSEGSNDASTSEGMA